MSSIVVKYGPRPVDGISAEGRSKIKFSGFSVFSTPLFEPFSQPQGSDPLIEFAVSEWDKLVGRGHGSILISSYDGDSYPGINKSESGCDNNVYAGTISGEQPLCSIIRQRALGDNAPSIDVIFDYRGTSGVDDPNVRPLMFYNA